MSTAPVRRFARFRLVVACVAFLFSCATWAQQTERSASLHGTVRNLQGEPVAEATVLLQPGGSGQTLTVRTDSNGKFDFRNLHLGVYTLSSSMKGYVDVRIPSIFLGSIESKTVDLTLGTPQSAQPSVAQPQFFDQPQFSVAGVTDTTNLGGHGSDTIVRTREKIAQDTVSLGKPGSEGPSSDLAATEKSLQEEIAHAPDQAKLHHELADVEEKLGNPLEAVRQYQRAAELDPSETYLFDWGSELLMHHAPEPALEVFANGNRRYPRSARLLIGLGATWFARGSYEQAVRPICQASDLKPDDPVPYLFLGKIQSAEKTASPVVVEELHRFVVVHPENAEANYYYAVALSKLPRDADRTSQIQSLLNQAVSIDPKFAPAWLQLGIVYSDQRDNPRALSSLQRAIQADPQMEEAHYRLAQVYRQTGDLEKARQELEIYEKLTKASAEKIERERHEIRQFVYTLRDQGASPPR